MSSPRAPNDLSGRSRCAPGGVLSRILEIHGKSSKSHQAIHVTPIIILAVNGGFAPTLPQLQTRTESNHYTFGGFAATSAPGASALCERPYLRRIQRKLFRVVTRAGQMCGAEEEDCWAACTSKAEMCGAEEEDCWTVCTSKAEASLGGRR